MSNCYICSSGKFVDDHHYDCQEGKLSPETVPLCRRCHRTYHDRGVEWFDDEYLDKAIEVENKGREIRNANLDNLNQDRLAESLKFPSNPWLKKLLLPVLPLRREDIIRSDYWNKKHGINKRAKKKPKVEKPEQLLLPIEVREGKLYPMNEPRLF